jgi:CBS domain-containing protein
MNVNEATSEDLLDLDGVGDRLARDILEARPFEHPEDLLDVPGIGEHRLESLRSQGVTVGPVEPERSAEPPAEERAPEPDEADGRPSLDDLDRPDGLRESPSQVPPTLQRPVGQTAQPPWTRTAGTDPLVDLLGDSPVQRAATDHRREAERERTDERPADADAVEREATEGPDTDANADEPPLERILGETAADAEVEGAASAADVDAGTATTEGDEDTERESRTGGEPETAALGDAGSTGGTASVFGPGVGRYVGQTLVLSVAFYLVLFALYVLTNPPTLTEEHVLIALVPFVILLVSSGKLREIRGPGGLLLTLQNEARSDILPEFTEDIQMSDQRPMEKGGAIDPEFEAEIERRRPTSLTFTLGRRGYYDFDLITQYVEVLTRRSPAFRYVVFLGRDDRFAGFVTVADFRAILDADLAAAFRRGASYDYLPERTSVVERIEDGDILNAAGVVTASVRQGATNEDALETMAEAGVDRLAVLDDRDRFLGVVTQDRIGRSMLLELFQRSNPA